LGRLSSWNVLAEDRWEEASDWMTLRRSLRFCFWRSRASFWSCLVSSSDSSFFLSCSTRACSAFLFAVAVAASVAVAVAVAAAVSISVAVSVGSDTDAGAGDVSGAASTVSVVDSAGSTGTADVAVAANVSSVAATAVDGSSFWLLMVDCKINRIDSIQCNVIRNSIQD